MTQPVTRVKYNLFNISQIRRKNATFNIRWSSFSCNWIWHKKWYDKAKENDVFKNNNKSFSMQDNKKTYTASDFYKPNSIFNEKQDTLNNNKSKEDEEIAMKMEAVFGKQF